MRSLLATENICAPLFHCPIQHPILNRFELQGTCPVPGHHIVTICKAARSDAATAQVVT